MGKLINYVEVLQGSEAPKFDGQRLKELSNLRNTIAHAKGQPVTAREADEAIRAAVKLKKLL